MGLVARVVGWNRLVAGLEITAVDAGDDGRPGVAHVVFTEGEKL